MTFTAADKRFASVAKALPHDAFALWCRMANEAEDLGFDHNGCVALAWEAVRKGWHRPTGKGRYVAKDNPGAGDVHVDVPLGSQRKKPKGKIVSSTDTFETAAKVCKVDEALGIVIGWAIVCTKNGEPYFDLQDDHIPDNSMLKAAADFMLNSRMGCEMHARDANGEVEPNGDIVFAFPLTAEIAKALEIDTPQTGLLVGWKPGDPASLAKFKSGELTGFSIGGQRLKDEEVD